MSDSDENLSWTHSNMSLANYINNKIKWSALTHIRVKATQIYGIYFLREILALNLIHCCKITVYSKLDEAKQLERQKLCKLLYIRVWLFISDRI